MQVVNNNPLDLVGVDGETVSVDVTSKGTVPVSRMNLNGATFVGPSFTLDKASTPFLLTVMVFFSGPSSGIYTITLRGSRGDGSLYTVTQFPGQASNAVTYTIDVT